MMSRLLSTPRRRFTAVLTVIAAVAFGSWALWPVRDPSCVVIAGAYLPMDATEAEIDAAVQRDFDRALADGACGPQRARFHGWKW
ncbi:hypothetical protein [Streptomyces sp. NPDC002490]|uniref:hypothetical protein n=1 Tax=Streptomyces sp. NPDC002490 TaxID=3154416 RepID=UPI003324291C